MKSIMDPPPGGLKQYCFEFQEREREREGASKISIYYVTSPKFIQVWYRKYWKVWNYLSEYKVLLFCLKDSLL